MAIRQISILSSPKKTKVIEPGVVGGIGVVDKNLSIFLGVKLFNRICKFKIYVHALFFNRNFLCLIYYCNFKKKSTKRFILVFSHFLL